MSYGPMAFSLEGLERENGPLTSGKTRAAKKESEGCPLSYYRVNGT